VQRDRRETLANAHEVLERIRAHGRDAIFFNKNAADEETRREVLTHITSVFQKTPGTLRVLLHSLAFGALKPLVGQDETASQRQIEMTSDVMGNGLAYWDRDAVAGHRMHAGGGIYPLTAGGGGKGYPRTGPVWPPRRSLKRTSGSSRSNWHRAKLPPTRSWPASPILRHFEKFRDMKNSWNLPGSATLTAGLPRRRMSRSVSECSAMRTPTG